MKQLMILLSILLISRLSIASNNELSQDVYKRAARNFLDQSAIKDIDKEFIVEFLNKRKSHAQNLLTKKLTKEERKKELLFFDTNRTRAFSLVDSNFLLANQYAQLTHVHRLYVLRKQLSCYISELTDFEQQYETPLEKVSSAEFQKRIRKHYTKYTLKQLLFSTSEKLTSAALEEISSQN